MGAHREEGGGFAYRRKDFVKSLLERQWDNLEEQEEPKADGDHCDHQKPHYPFHLEN